MRLAIIAALGGFLFGYDTVSSGRAVHRQGPRGHGNFDQQAFVGSLLVGAVVGAILSGFSADALSRRRTKIIAGAVYVVGALGSAFSQTATELIIARFVLGTAVGTASFVAPMYISELAPKRIRGGITSFNQLMIVGGILTAYIANWALKGAANNWRWMLGLGAIPGAALAIGMFFQPFSPRWLIKKDREDEAREVLRRVRDSDKDVENEIDEIKDAARQEGGLREALSPAVRPLVALGLALAIAQQFIGVNTVIYYAPTILKSTGIATTSAITQALSVGLANVIFTIVAVLILDRVGRRPLLITGTVGCIVSLVVLGVFFASKSLQHSVSWLALVCLIVYIASFAVGLGPVFWLMISEIFPLRVRSPAISIRWSPVGRRTSLSVVLSLAGRCDHGRGDVLLYQRSVLAFIDFIFRVPETKDRTLEQIERELGAEESEPAHTA